MLLNSSASKLILKFYIQISMNIVVDLDKSCLKTDLFIESLLKLVLSKPWLAFTLIKKLLFSKSECKSYVANKIPINPKILAYNEEVLKLIMSYKKNGYKLILSTGAPLEYAEENFGIIISK